MPRLEQQLAQTLRWLVLERNRDEVQKLDAHESSAGWQQRLLPLLSLSVAVQLLARLLAKVAQGMALSHHSQTLLAICMPVVLMQYLMDEHRLVTDQHLQLLKPNVLSQLPLMHDPASHLLLLAHVQNYCR